MIDMVQLLNFNKQPVGHALIRCYGNPTRCSGVRWPPNWGAPKRSVEFKRIRFLLSYFMKCMNRWNNCLHLEKISNYEITTTAFFFVVDKNKSEKTSKPAITLALLIEVSCNDFKSESNLGAHHVEFSFLPIVLSLRFRVSLVPNKNIHKLVRNSYNQFF